MKESHIPVLIVNIRLHISGFFRNIFRVSTRKLSILVISVIIKQPTRVL